MRTRLAFWTIAMVALAAPQLFPQTTQQSTTQTGGTTIRGMVTLSGTEEGIPEVQIALTPMVVRGGLLATAPAEFDPQALRETGARLGAPQEMIERAIAQQAAIAAVSAGNPTASYSAVSDASGRFTIADVLPGGYEFTAQREGYAAPTTTTGGVQAVISRQITITTGQPVPDIPLTLVRGGTISGRVVDAAGRSLSNVSVEALRTAYQNGHQVLQASISKTTDDRGEFRLFGLPPGEYVIAATPIGARGGRGVRGAQANTVIPAADLPVRTFYPREIDPALAAKVVLESGHDFTGADVAIRVARTFTIKGQAGTAIRIVPVVGPQGQVRGGQLALAIVPRAEPQDARSARASVNVALDQSGSGPFEMAGLPPGSYNLVARVTIPNPAPAAQPGRRGGNGGNFAAAAAADRLVFGRMPLEVRGDMEGINFSIPEPVELKGTVAFKDTTATVPANVRIVLVVPVDYADAFPIYGRGAQAAATSGAFTFPSVFQGDYFVQVALPAAGERGGTNVYVEDVRQGGASIYDAGFTIDGGNPPAPLQIILNSGGGSVEGTAYASDRKPMSGVSVVLAPAMQRRKNVSLYRTVVADAAGHFVIRSIAPGDYKLFSWEELIPTAAQNAIYMQKYESRGQPVTIRSLATANADVTVIGNK